MQMVFANNQRNDASYESIDKELQNSVSKSHELYHLMMLLPVALKRLALKRIENGKNKIRPTQEELNPNLKFVENRFIKEIENNIQLNEIINKTGLSWDNDDDLVKIIFNGMTATDMYKEYMESDTHSFEEDQKFIIRFFTKELPKIELMYEALELKSIYWNDDVEFAISIAIKTFKLFDGKNGADVEMLPTYKDDDDKEFVATLLRKTLATYNSTFELIKKYSKNWDPERVAQMDIIIIVMATAEMTAFRELPIRVTLNEYIEIAKYYSTAKSNIFINGLLEKIVRQLVEEKKISATQLITPVEESKDAE